ncbi:MAG: EamA family transporter [Acidimicrobiales bacterium]
MSVQFGAGIAKEIIPITGAVGTVFYRVAFAAILMCLAVRPTLRGRSRADWGLLVAFGVVLAAMNVCFYAALQHLPIGVTVTLEFTGPLGVAILGTRRRIDIFWALLAAVGLVLLSPITGVDLDVVGVVLAVGAGGFWAMYILLSHRVGERVSGMSGLALALVASAAVTAIPAVATAGTTLLQPKVIGIGVVVALMASAIPYACELEALRSLSPSGFGMLMSLEPAVAALAGAVVLGEHLGAPELLAIAFVLLANAGAVVTRRPSPSVDLGNVAP